MNILEDPSRKVNSHFDTPSRTQVSIQPKSHNGQELKAAREAVSLTQEQAARLLDVTGRTISNWETKGAPPREARGAFDAYRSYAAGRVDLLERVRGAPRHVSESGGDDYSGPRFPIANLLRSPVVRGWLNAFQAELIERGASLEEEASVMRTVTDQATISAFIGGERGDQYTLEEVQRAMEIIALAARRFLQEPDPTTARGAVLEDPDIPAERPSSKKEPGRHRA